MSEFYKALGGWVEQGGEVIRRFVDLCWPTWTEHHKEFVDPAMAFQEQMSRLNLMFTSTESTREFLATRQILAHLMEEDGMGDAAETVSMETAAVTLTFEDTYGFPRTVRPAEAAEQQFAVEPGIGSNPR
jgi:hypothetical protein